MNSSKHHGSSLDDFLKDQDLFEQTQALAIKEVAAWEQSEAAKPGEPHAAEDLSPANGRSSRYPHSPR
ncbi:hypothetical protein GT347_25805 [Xylophilus rhododendri]|uniref:Uncharacterized protein n=1 Tax=Xylophilus rhododendri TaxID=2697032 RepID=A0A857JDB4_9BURK|nr:hypothetical protein [Xylophilus rhododendri]QHJ01100.1 hypothetical protein GT347_25805 [Xylophilus rhododendri]